MHEALHGVGLCAEVRNASALERFGCRLILAQPDGEHGLSSISACAVPLDGADDGLGRRGRACERGRHIEDEHGIVCRIGEQCFERVRVARRIRVPDDIDRVSARPRRRQKSVQRRQGLVRNPGECTAEVDQSIDREHADAAAVGENGEASPSKRSLRPSVSAAAKVSSRSNTRSRPARRNTAS